jgi:hypothetical protein
MSQLAIALECSRGLLGVGKMHSGLRPTHNQPEPRETHQVADTVVPPHSGNRWVASDWEKAVQRTPPVSHRCGGKLGRVCKK